MRRYSDEQLITAVSGSHSWRAVLRALGLASTSAGAMRSVRRQADLLEVDYSHFRGQRRWSDRDLVVAVASSSSWNEVFQALGLVGGSSGSTLRGHAVRLGLDTRHLGAGSPPQHQPDADLSPQLTLLPRAGALLAAAWFELCGAQVAWPLEPSRYDLLVWRNGATERIQVKTTTLNVGSSWKVQLATRRKELHTYGPDEIDKFFIIDGELQCYLIPVKVVGGLIAIHLAKYARFQVVSPVRLRLCTDTTNES